MEQKNGCTVREYEEVGGGRMKEYIERAQLLKNLGYDEKRRADVLPGSTFDIVLKEPAASVAEVRHGKLNFVQEDMSYCYYGICNVCGAYVQAWNYCPNCGALMKEDEYEAG